jgi:hypothetical protein
VIDLRQFDESLACPPAASPDPGLLRSTEAPGTLTRPACAATLSVGRGICHKFGYSPIWKFIETMVITSTFIPLMVNLACDPLFSRHRRRRQPPSGALAFTDRTNVRHLSIDTDSGFGLTIPVSFASNALG